MASRSSITEKDVAEAFVKIEEELIAGIIRNFERHQVEQVSSGMQWSMWQTEQLASLEAYSRNNVKKYGKQFDQLNKAIEQFISRAYSGGRAKQERAIANAMKQGWTPSGAFFEVPTHKLDALINATHSDMMKAEYSVLRRANDLYRDTIFKSQVYATSGAGTYAQAIDMATKDFLASGINGIVYSNGSKHTIEEYSAMVIRTSTKRAAFVGEGDAREEWGVHTVFVAERDDACDVCLDWVGQILIDDVYGGGTSKEAEETGYALLSEAMDAGLFHPNCRDTMTTYFEGVNKPPKTPSKGAKSCAEAREEVEQLESTARNNEARYGRLSEYSLDPANQAKYEAKAAEWGERAEQVDSIAARIYAPSLSMKITTPASVEEISDFVRYGNIEKQIFLETAETIAGRVTQEKAATPDSFETFAAEVLGKLGFDVKLRERSLASRKADALINGKTWEFKNPTGNSPLCIHNQIRSNLYGQDRHKLRPQSTRVAITNIRNELTLEDMEKQLIEVMNGKTRFSEKELSKIKQVMLVDRSGEARLFIFE